MTSPLNTIIDRVTPNNVVREVSLGIVAEIPILGGIYEVLLNIFWPESEEDIWEEIKDKVAEMIDDKIRDYKYNDVKDKLKGLGNVLFDYQQALSDYHKTLENNENLSHDDLKKQIEEGKNTVNQMHGIALGALETIRPSFQSEGYEVLLLPMFASLVNFHFLLLKDLVKFGEEFGWNIETVKSHKAKLKNCIEKDLAYVQKYYKQGFEDLKLPTEGHNLKTQRWLIQNRYVRNMTLAVLDSAFYWPYFDPDTLEAAGGLPKLTREVYADIQGTAEDNPINLAIDPRAKKTPTFHERITHMRIWGWQQIDAVQHAFGGKWGTRMGDQQTKDHGGSNVPPHGWNGEIHPDNPIIKVHGESGAILNALQLEFKDGTKTNVCGGLMSADKFSVELEEHVVSQIYIPGESHYYKCAECAIVGFRLADSY